MNVEEARRKRNAEAVEWAKSVGHPHPEIFYTMTLSGEDVPPREPAPSLRERLRGLLHAPHA